jgi:class 3 adenylate cyclase
MPTVRLPKVRDVPFLHADRRHTDVPVTESRPSRFVRSFNEPDELIELETVRSAQVTIGGLTVSYDTQQPGWRWSTHVKPVVGTEWCEVRHVGMMLSGRQHILLRDGTEFTLEPLDVMDLPAGHDAWVIGDEPCVTVGWTGARGWLAPLESLNDRVLATVLFVDTVDSTVLASRIGDRAWGDLFASYIARAEDILPRYRGRLIKTTGDGLLATFDGAARALRCAIALRDAAADLDLSVRAAVHTGEIELADDDIRGVAIHEASRMMGLAAGGEVLVSATTVALVGEADVSFQDRGEHELRGLPGRRHLYALGG